MNPGIADGVVVSPVNTPDGCYGVFDAEKGKLLFSQTVVPDHQRSSFIGRVREELLGNHKLAVAVNGFITLYDVEEPCKKILETKVHDHRDAVPAILGWNRDFLILRGDVKTALLYFLSVPANQPVRLTLAPRNSVGDMVPFRAIIDADRAYVFASPKATIQKAPRYLPPYACAVKGLVVKAFDPVTGEELWTCTPDLKDHSQLMPFVVETQRRLVVTFWQVGGADGFCLLIDKETGKVSQRLRLSEDDYKIESMAMNLRRWRAIAAEERLAVETGKGITVYGK
jgi:hypothetical protein